MFRISLGVLSLCAVSMSHAIVATSVSATNIPEFSFVGTVNGASGVLVGPDLVLTAAHVGHGAFTLPEQGTFNVVGEPTYYYNGDLVLFRINANLSNYATIDISNNVVGSQITMVGFGESGSTNLWGDGYEITEAGGIRRSGVATVEGTIELSDPAGLRGDFLVAPLRDSADAALVGGDSGGGWFNSEGNLVGISSWTGLFGTWGDNYRFSTSPTDYFGSGAVNLATYSQFLTENGVTPVPEPGAYATLILGIGFFAVMRRRAA